MSSLSAKVKSLIRDVKDFPKKGIVFKDITPILKDGVTFDRVVAAVEAYGRKRGRPDLFPGAETLHVPRADHFDLLNHPDVHDALRRWLA